MTLLKIDVDRPRGRLTQKQLAARARIVHVRIVRVVDTRSPSGWGWHRRIEIERAHVLDRVRKVQSDCVGDVRQRGRAHCRDDARSVGRMAFTPLEIVFLQLLFGSDPIRESFNWHRARLVQAGAVPRFWRRRFNTLYATSGGR